MEELINESYEALCASPSAELASREKLEKSGFKNGTSRQLQVVEPLTLIVISIVAHEIRQSLRARSCKLSSIHR